MSEEIYVLILKPEPTNGIVELIILLLANDAHAIFPPLYNGGTPALTGTTPCLILQQFTVFSVGTSRYIGTSISCFQ